MFRVYISLPHLTPDDATDTVLDTLRILRRGPVFNAESGVRFFHRFKITPMLKSLIARYGKQKINSLTKYPSIPTLHRLGDKGRLTNELSVDFSGETIYASEKIDGTNVRIILGGNEAILGSREFLLAHSDDLFFDPAMGIVDAIRNSDLDTSEYDLDVLVVLYGELYGGKVTANSKNYGCEKLGFRLFDVAIIPNELVLEMPIENISLWRERETPSGFVYGQSFARVNDFYSDRDVPRVPQVKVDLGDFSHEAVLAGLRVALPQTMVPLSDSALLRPEGIVIRNADRSKIAKIRFEDYERSLR